MKSKRMYRFSALMICLGIVLFVISCDGDYEPVKAFDYNLWGTWVSNAPDTQKYTPGTLIITFDTIEITGYGLKYQDTVLPFSEFPRDIPLSGYSEEGKLYIKKAGIFQNGISYTYDDMGWGKPKLLYITFGGLEEILQKTD